MLESIYTKEKVASGFLYGQSPDSEQIERIEPMAHKRNSASVEEIQDKKKLPDYGNIK